MECCKAVAYCMQHFLAFLLSIFLPLCLDLGFFYCILCKGFIQFCFRICVKGILESNTIMLPTLWRLIHAWIVMPYNSVKLQFAYELSFLSVFWITSKSNQKYMLDVVNEIFYRSGSPKTRHREASWLLNSFILRQACLYIWYQRLCITGGSQNDQIR